MATDGLNNLFLFIVAVGDTVAFAVAMCIAAHLCFDHLQGGGEIIDEPAGTA